MLPDGAARDFLDGAHNELGQRLANEIRSMLE